MSTNKTLMVQEILMKPMNIEMVSDGGPWVEHNYPCPVFNELNAVYEVHNGKFQPSWHAQRLGYKLVHANTWIKRLALKLVFGIEVEK